MKIEVLYFDGCPHHEQTLATVRRIASELAVDADIERVRVADAEDAERLRFLGSPTVRVGGRDVEPKADARGQYALACRIPPREEWLRAALAKRV
jgi:hypothetical protein